MKNLLLSSYLWMMAFIAPAFSQHVTLNPSWHFIKTDRSSPEELKDLTGWSPTNLPHTWNREDINDEEKGYYRGTGWYKKELLLPKTTNNQLYLVFEGANQHTTVFVNGKKAGEHTGGYTAFVVDITPFARFEEVNTLLVKVNNRHDRNVPPLSGDFSFYGGIYRDVWLVRKPGLHFDVTDGSTKGIYVGTPAVTRENARVQARAMIKNITDTKYKRCEVVARIFDREHTLITGKKEKLTVNPGETLSITMELEVPQPHLWSPADPYLYTTEVQLVDNKTGKILDSFSTKTGLRWFEMGPGRSFYLNGQPMKLIGANRHQDHPGLGNAMDNALHRRDIEILKAMGGNFIRIAHYPQDPALLEACDELGILAWEEIPIVNSITLSNEFTANAQNRVKEMIRQHYNHPSVIMWGFMNEVLLKVNNGLQDNPGVDKETYINAVSTLAQTLHDLCKAEDPQRWTTIAHHANYGLYNKAGLNDITDIVGWNLYFGWYGTDMSKAGDFLDRFHREHPGKGIILAEYGGGSDKRTRATTPKRFDFSVEWQTAIHASYYRQIEERPHVMGGTVWNFADFNSEGRRDAVPHINSKGLLNQDRSPKDSYLFYQAALSKKPYLEIGSLDWRHRKGFANKQNKLEQPVFIFSNQPTINVRLNGRSIGEFTIKDHHALVPVPFENGHNTLTIACVAGGQALTKEGLFKAEVIPTSLSSLTAGQIDIHMNLGAHFHFQDDITHETWLPEREYSEGSLGYVGGTRLTTWDGQRVGTDVEIFGSNNEPLYQTHRDSIQGFRADVPDGWYEVRLGFAEVYSQKAREKLAYNLGAEGDDHLQKADRSFQVLANDQHILTVAQLDEFHANEYRFRLKTKPNEGIHIMFKPLKGSVFLSFVSIKGL